MVAGTKSVNARLIQLLLMRKGEDPIHTNLGFAPDLFASKTAQDPYLYTYKLNALLRQWNEIAKIGIESFTTRVFDLPTSSILDIEIRYVPVGSDSSQLLTYGFFEYVEAFQGSNISAYLQSVRFTSD